MITYFKSLTSTTEPFYKPIEHALDRIKNGASKELCERVRSTPGDKAARNKIKKLLPAICFSGKFTKRSSDSIFAHSGFICIDFDSFIDEWSLIDYRDFLCKDKYSFAVFTSPSGDGLKVIVKIPKDISNHKNYFLSLEKYYNVPEFDVTTKDISRICYESYDPEIFINNDSEVWDTLLTEEHTVFETKTARGTIKIDSPNEIIRRLLIWWEREFGMVAGSKNNNLFVLASALNEFGISESEATNVMMNYDEGGKHREIVNIIRSAYKNASAHNTKFYEDTNKVDSIKAMAKKGVPTAELVSINKKIDQDLVKAIVDNTDDDSNCFWTKSSKGIVSHVNHLYKYYLESMGYAKLYVEGGVNFVLVKINNNTISDVFSGEVKNMVLNDYLINLEDKSIFNYFADKNRLFEEDHLSFLKTIEPKIMKDNERVAYLYYRNCVVKVTADGYSTIDYMDIDGYIWEKQKIDRDFVPVDFDDCVYKKFIGRIGSDDSERVKSIESTIGYLLHSHKPPSYAPAVILNDEIISDNPMGGTGKSLFVKAISMVKKNITIDGKSFSFNKSFPYQRVSADTQVLVFDDVSRNFDFEKLFSIITEGITLEKKNKDEIKIPFERSPKIIITTNYAIKGVGTSHERRKWELEFAQHYTKSYTPETEFGHQFFSGWDDCEWNKFDSYMISNLQLYLKNGFVKAKYKNLKERHLIASTSMDFFEWAKDSFNTMTKVGHENFGQSIFNNFVEANPDYSPRGNNSLKLTTFYRWLDLYGDYTYNSVPSRTRLSNGIVFEFKYKKPEQKKLIL
jgi:hypothetical protein